MFGNLFGSVSDFCFVNLLFQDFNKVNSCQEVVVFSGNYEFNGFIIFIDFGVWVIDCKFEWCVNQVGGFNVLGGNCVILVSLVGVLFVDFFVFLFNCIFQINGCQYWMMLSVDYLCDYIDMLWVFYGSQFGDLVYVLVNNYDLIEKVYVVYIQLYYEIILGGMCLDGVFGGCLVCLECNIVGVGMVNGVVMLQSVLFMMIYFLFNVSVKFEVVFNLLVCVMVGVMMVCFVLGDLNLMLNYFVLSNFNICFSGGGGNFELKDQMSIVYDFLVECYFGKGSYLQVVVYYCMFKDCVVSVFYFEIIGGIEYDIICLCNVGKVMFSGLEFSVQYFLDFLFGVMSGLGVFGNYIMVDSKVKMLIDLFFGKLLLGVFKYSVNVGLFYEKYGFISWLIYIWCSKFNEGQFGCEFVLFVENGMVVGVCDFGVLFIYNCVKVYGCLDFVLGYQFNEQFSVSFNVNNLIGFKYYSYFQSESFLYDICLDDKFYGVSFNFKL